MARLGILTWQAAHTADGIRLLLMGGIGVDPFAKTTQSESENFSSAMRAVCNTDQQWQLDSQGR